MKKDRIPALPRATVIRLLNRMGESYARSFGCTLLHRTDMVKAWTDEAGSGYISLTMDPPELLIQKKAKCARITFFPSSGNLFAFDSANAVGEAGVRWVKLMVGDYKKLAVSEAEKTERLRMSGEEVGGCS